MAKVRAVKFNKRKNRRRNPDGMPLSEFTPPPGLEGHEGMGAIKDFLLHHVAPTATSYALNRFVSNFVSGQLKKKAATWGNWVNYSPPVASALTAVGVYCLTKYVKALQHYHESATVGSVLAFIHTTLLTFATPFAALLGVNVLAPVQMTPELPPADDGEPEEQVVEVDAPPVVAGSSMDGSSIPSEPESYADDYGSLGNEAN